MNTLKYDKNETYICQTDARVKYLLTLKDLKNIPYVARRALNYYSKSKIYLYRLKDIEDKSKDKYGGNFETVKKQKEEYIIEKSTKNNIIIYQDCQEIAETLPKKCTNSSVH